MLSKIATRQNLLKAVTLVSAAALTADYFLKVWGQEGLCSTDACQLAAEQLRIPEIFLIMAGAYFFWGLWLFMFFGDRYQRPILWILVTLGLWGGLAFDGALLGYQFVGLGEPCQLCAGVGAALMAVLLCTAWSRRSWFILCVGLSVFASGFAANSLLTFRTQPPQLQETAFGSQLSGSETEARQFYFFFSFHCGHCRSVMQNVGYQPSAWKADWHLCCVDTREQDLQKMAYALDQTQGNESLILKILEVEHRSDIPAVQVSEELRTHAQTAADYLRHMGYRGVPLLVALEAPGRKTIVSGGTAIAKYLYSLGLIERWIGG